MPRGGLFASLACLIALQACAECSRIVLARTASPAGKYVAELHSLDCGGATPYNLRVVLENTKTKASRQILQLNDALFEITMAWRSEGALRITIDCPTVPGPDCLPASNRAWSLDKRPNWESVNIDYVLGERLASEAPAKVLEKLRR